MAYKPPTFESELARYAAADVEFTKRATELLRNVPQGAPVPWEDLGSLFATVWIEHYGKQK